MRIRVDPHASDVAAPPRSLHWGGRRIEVLETIDQWHGADYRYVKVKARDRGIYILRFDENSGEWAMIMFVSARAQALTAPAA